MLFVCMRCISDFSSETSFSILLSAGLSLLFVSCSFLFPPLPVISAYVFFTCVISALSSS